MSARTGGGGKGGQPNLDRPGQGRGVPKIPKFVRTSFIDDPFLQWYRVEKKIVKVNQMIPFG